MGSGAVFPAQEEAASGVVEELGAHIFAAAAPHPTPTQDSYRLLHKGGAKTAGLEPIGGMRGRHTWTRIGSIKDRGAHEWGWDRMAGEA